MKRYWDTSALVDALHDFRIEALALEPEQWTRPHSLAEAFSTLTGGRLGFRYLPSDAAALLRELTAGFSFMDWTRRKPCPLCKKPRHAGCAEGVFTTGCTPAPPKRPAWRCY